MKTRIWSAVCVRVAAIFLCCAFARVTCGESCPPCELFGSGGFFIGCNYWAQHAGMYMWSRWDRAAVEREVEALSKNGVRVMRVFPLWSDFQPLTHLNTWNNDHAEIVQANGPLQNIAGVDMEMMRRFRMFCDIARKNDIRLIVGLVTGWMSGQMFVPPAFDDRNVLTDAEAVMWTTRFVRYFVENMKDHPAIAAWDFGNECNCMGRATAAEFYNWMNAVGSAIRLADDTRPVVSGLHGMSTKMSAKAPIRLVGELADVLTTHPYSFYVPGCAADPLGTMRPTLHPSAESLLYEHIGGKPCFIEEIGSIGTSCNSEERTASAMRATLFCAWANDLKGFLWWCNADQEELHFPPYDWTAYERELGMLRPDMSPKPVMVEMRRFDEFRKSLPFARLPPRRTDCVIVVPERTDGWPCSFGAYLLAVQAGFSPVFAGTEHDLPESGMYIVCSAEDVESYTYTAQRRIFAKAKAGASVLLLYGSKSRFTRLAEQTGLAADYGTKAPVTRRFPVPGNPGEVLVCKDEWTCRLAEKGCEVLSRTDSGEPAFTVFGNGKGKVMVCNSPIDREAISRTDAFSGAKLMPYYKIFAAAREIAGVKGVVTKIDCPHVAITEHPLGDGRVVVVAVNCEPRAIDCRIKADGRLDSVWRGDVTKERILLPANDAAVFCVTTR